MFDLFKPKSIAFKLIEESIRTQNPHLDIGKCDLTDEDFTKGGKLDKALRKCGHLQSLNLSTFWFDHDNKKAFTQQKRLPEAFWVKSRNFGESNQLNHIPIAINELKNLQRLIISGVHTFKFVNCNFSSIFLPKLTYLDVSNNKFSTITGLENFSQLKQLFLDRNQIISVSDFASLSHLQQLDLSSNKITAINGLENLFQLRELNLAMNQITDIRSLKSLSQLQLLDLNWNQITSISALGNLSQLLELSLRENKLDGLIEIGNLSKLKSFNLINNRISDISGLENLSKLEKLDCCGNQIENLKPFLPLLKSKKELCIVIKSPAYLELHEINVANNPLFSPPIEVVEEGKQAILNYFNELKTQGTYAEVNIPPMIDGFFAEVKEKAVKKTKKQTIKIFLAASSELKHEREQFEIFINRENKRLNDRDVFLRLEIWEDFLDAVSKTRLQDQYNKIIDSCDIFVMLFFTKVGKYTAEEFERAFRQFKETDKPKIFTYFKSADLNTENINRRDVNSLLDFKDKLTELGHFYTTFKNNEGFHLHFKNQLERLYGL